jgi:hypothetical protein
VIRADILDFGRACDHQQSNADLVLSSARSFDSFPLPHESEILRTVRALRLIAPGLWRRRWWRSAFGGIDSACNRCRLRCIHGFRFGQTQADVALNLPFELRSQRLRYSGQWRAQWNSTPLTPQDRFAIGGRFSERGWLVRNDIGWALPGEPFGKPLGAELYLGIDDGQVSGRSADQLLGKHLAGAACAVRCGD